MQCGHAQVDGSGREETIARCDKYNKGKRNCKVKRFTRVVAGLCAPCQSQREAEEDADEDEAPQDSPMKWRKTNRGQF